MNKSAIQRYAVWARTEMIAQVSQRAYQYGITPEGYGDFDAVSISGHLLSDSERKQRQGVIRQIQTKGYTQAMEEIAYTWFNRFIALRFMEVNNYLPSHIRVFTDSSGAFKPEILTQALHLDLPGLDMDKVAHLIEENQNEDLYRYLLLTQCNALNSALPRMFESLGSYTELLLPNNILRQDGVIGRMVSDIPEEDWTDQVQIIGWLYQYYNAELKSETLALLKKNIKITKERIPSATQLFTPDWIVRYMVENSLGRLWIAGHPDDELKSNWKYYLDEAEQELSVQTHLEAIREEYRSLRPQDIKIIDPCMGSGHILVYAFDILVQIYNRAGYSERDAAKNILENNLYGLDIDDRAAQLAYFAVMMKARQYDRRIFSHNIQPHLYPVVESNDIKIIPLGLSEVETRIVNRLVSELKDAKEYGSILKVSLTEVELNLLQEKLLKISNQSMSYFDKLEIQETCFKLLDLINFCSILARKYTIYITNPPYMDLTNANSKIKQYQSANYQGHGDLYSICISKGLSMVYNHGYVAMITMQGWMFSSTNDTARKELLNNTIINLLHLGSKAFDSDVGTIVQVASFVIQKACIPDYKGRYVRLVDGNSTLEKIDLFLSGKNVFIAAQNGFNRIPSEPIAYWVSSKVQNLFQTCPPLSTALAVKAGLSTGNNDLFCRQWFEVCYDSIEFNCKSIAESTMTGKKWFPCNSGGDYRRWTTANRMIVDWEHNGFRIKNYRNTKGNIGSAPRNTDFYFLEGLTWNKISSRFSIMYKQPGFIFDDTSRSAFVNDDINLFYILGFLSSSVAIHCLQAINQTFCFTNNDLLRLPFIYSINHISSIEQIVKSSIRLSVEDWNINEVSWEFVCDPIVQKALEKIEYSDNAILIEDCYSKFKTECNQRADALQIKQKSINQIFIDIYNLIGELDSDVDSRDLTTHIPDQKTDIKSMISYAVGCMFGRYSLDISGLAYAGGNWDSSKYSSFIPDDDNIIPICDDEYFEDDITGLFVKWVRVVFGAETLEENLKFIADALGGKGAPREVIRNYFINGFYADHLKVYQKRPIYWLFDSGKKNGFKALIYIHRYRSDLLACMRTDYVHEQQERYRTQLRHIGDAMGSASASERVMLTMQQKKLQEQSLEIQKYEEKIHHLADQNIKIDLDDGVAHNYEIFSEVLAKRK